MNVGALADAATRRFKCECDRAAFGCALPIAAAAEILSILWHPVEG